MKKIYFNLIVLCVSILLISCQNTDEPAVEATVESTADTSAKNDVTTITEVNFVAAGLEIENTPRGIYMTLALAEAFKRHGINYNVRYVPIKRAVEMVDSGEADGDTNRIETFTANGANPNHIRVDTPYLSGSFISYAQDPAAEFDSWQSLTDSGYVLGYRDGTKRYRDKLGAVLPAERIVFVPNNNKDALLMLAAGRFDVYLTGMSKKHIIEELLQTEAFKDSGLHYAGLVARHAVYAYMHKKHAELASKIAVTLEKMKTEGVLEQYIEQSQCFDIC